MILFLLLAELLFAAADAGLINEGFLWLVILAAPGAAASLCICGCCMALLAVAGFIAWLLFSN